MNFELRPWSMDDAGDLIKAANNPRIACFMTDSFPHPYTQESAEKFLSWATNNCPSTLFAIVVDGKASGGIGIHPQTDILRTNAELGYWLSEEYWGKGIVTEAIRQIIPVAFERYPITRLFGRVFSNNLPSQKALQKAGFVLEAQFQQTILKNGVFLGELIFAYRKR